MDVELNLNVMLFEFEYECDPVLISIYSKFMVNVFELNIC